MHRYIAMCLLGLLPGWHAAAQTRDPVRQVIQAQLEAFGQNDGPGAFRFASPGIQAQFGDATHFLAMVHTAYPVLFNPQSVTFGDQTSAQGHVLQKVELVGERGQAALAIYDMEREPDGDWKIAGCMLVKSERIET